MQNQKKQLIFMLMLLVIIAAVYAGIRVYNEKQEEKEKSESEAETVTLTELASEEITGFCYQLSNETYSLTKNGKEWIYEGAPEIKLDTKAIETMLAPVLNLTASEEITEYETLSDYGLNKPENTITINTDAGIVTLYVGTQNGITGKYHIKTGDSDSVYVISTNLASYFTQTPQELAAEEETEEAN